VARRAGRPGRNRDEPFFAGRVSQREAMTSLAERLALVMSEALADDVTVESLQRLTGGASRETWAFDAVGSVRGRMPLVLRRDPPGAASAGMSLEVLAFEAARRAGVPVPGILASGDDPAGLEAPFIIMDRLEGETLPRRILRDERFSSVRPTLAEQCGEILARIHSIPVGEVPGLQRPDALEIAGAMIHAYADAAPGLEVGLRWLLQRQPPRVPDVVVHGDFRNGNLIVGPEGVTAVLDWELVHLGDPMQDLGYLCARVWRFGAEPPVGGWGEYEDLFRGYERVSGRRVDRDAVRWWELYGSVWFGGACLLQAWRHLSGDERSLELAAIGRRVREQEYDAMLMLEDWPES
jgi:aminoglycoside phosphotransferase (APT) family kinase protein